MPEIKSWVDVAQIAAIATIFWLAAEGLAHRIVYTIEWFQGRKKRKRREGGINPGNRLVKVRNALIELLEREKEEEEKKK